MLTEPAAALALATSLLLLFAMELERPLFMLLPPCFDSIEGVAASLKVAPEMSLIKSVTVFGGAYSGELKRS